MWDEQRDQRSLYKGGVALIAPRVYVDSRGSLINIGTPDPLWQHQYLFTINPGQERGGHYHTRKTEWFVVVSGSVDYLQAAVRDGVNEPCVTEIANCSGSGGQLKLFEIQPFTWHKFINRSSSHSATVVAFSSEKFDSDDHDTFIL